MFKWLSSFFNGRCLSSNDYDYYNRLVSAFSFLPQISDWQLRERVRWYGSNLEKQYGPCTLELAQRAAAWVQKNIKYVPDEIQFGRKEYWATSKEVQNNMQDDCDGQAVMAWALLRLAGCADNNIGLCIVPGHMFCIMYEDKKSPYSDFYVIDNGYLSYPVVRASELFPAIRGGESLSPIVAFNIFNIWGFPKGMF